MSIDEIASFCEFRDCKIMLGDPEVGFLHLNGRGIDQDLYTFGRFNMFGEMKNPSSPEQVVKAATVFRIRRGDETRELNREDFEAELGRFLKLVQD